MDDNFNISDFSDFSDSLETMDMNIEKLNPENEKLEKLVLEFQNDLTDKNKSYLSFIKFTISLIKKHEIDLPILPHILNKIIELSNSEDSTFEDYANLVRTDPSITLKIIKLANSPLYRGLRDVSSVDLAISRVGIDGLKEVVLTDSLKEIVFKNNHYAELIGEIWENSIITALIAVRLSDFFDINSSKLYTISLVHRIGSVIIFDIIEKYNQKTDFENYISDDFVLRIGRTFNKRLTVNILTDWYFSQNQISSLKNYDIKPVPVARVEHKILYLSQITANALKVIKKDYDEDNIFPYVFMIKESFLDISPETFKNIVDDSLKYYNDFLKFLYN